MPWHPFIVHFPIALWTMGCLFLISGKRFPHLTQSGWILLSIAGITALAAAISGQSDFQPLTEIPETIMQHRKLGIILPWLMGALLLLKGHFTLKKRKGPNTLFTVFAWAILVLLLYTARLGGKAVYEFGIGQN